jgi:hypothetical protein
MNSRRVHVPRLTVKLHWDEPEDVMNKLMTAALIAGGLMLMNSPEAAAHKQVRHAYQPPAHTYVEVRRSSHMPRWLARDRAFRKWYRHTSLRRNRHLAWHQLVDIYRWELRFGRNYYRSDNFWVDYYAHRYGERHYDRDGRRRRH